LIHSSRRSRIVVAPQAQSAIEAYEQPGPQDLDEFFEDDPVRDPRPVAAQRVRRVIDGPVGQQRGELVPQRFQQP
jgi:hypothetical protein